MSNDISLVIPQILAQGLLALRKACVMPLLVNRDYESDAARKGAVVTIPIPSARPVTDVAPGPTPPAATGIAPTVALIPLDQWKQSDFTLTDKEIQEAQTGVVPMEVSEAVSAIANVVNAFIFSKYKGVYGFTGTPGTTPFVSDTTGATNVRKVLNNQMAPKPDRRFVIDSDAEANALNLRAFQDASFSTTGLTILEGEIGRKLGFNWASDQQVPTHTAGSVTGTIVTSGSGNTAGVTSVLLDSGSGEAIALLEGDIVTFAGHSQTYVVREDLTVGASATGSVKIAPSLQVTVAAGVALTLKASHVVNLGFHRDAFAFASRPLSDIPMPGSLVQAITDPKTGLTLRLEVTRQHKQTNWCFDMLYGAALVRRELAARLAG